MVGGKVTKKICNQQKNIDISSQNVEKKLFADGIYV